MNNTPSEPTTASPAPSVLRPLRALVPRREATFAEALRIAEIQATRLAQLLACDDTGIFDHHLADLPRLQIDYADIPVSGMSHWNGQAWIITIARHESPTRQRFTLLHEFKHIVDHGCADRLYCGDRNRSPEEQAELAADYFAGCALVPKRGLKAAWGNGVQRPKDLAGHFGVSEPAIRVRLAQTGIDLVSDQPHPARCARPMRTQHGQPQSFRTVRRRYNRKAPT